MDCQKIFVVRKWLCKILNVINISTNNFAIGFTLSFSLSPPQNLSTPLHLAAREGHDETCKVLLGKGAEVNGPNKVISNSPRNFQCENCSSVHVFH